MLSIGSLFGPAECKQQVDFEMPAKTHRRIVEFLCLVLAGCGTSVTGLLEEESQFLWQADPIIGAAEDLDRGLENSVYDAESAKNEACEVLFDATRGRIYAAETSFARQFWSDFTRAFVRIVPVAPVERCAEAQKRYKEELATLCHDLGQAGGEVPCLD